MIAIPMLRFIVLPSTYYSKNTDNISTYRILYFSISFLKSYGYFFLVMLWYIFFLNGNLFLQYLMPFHFPLPSGAVGLDCLDFRASSLFWACWVNSREFDPSSSLLRRWQNFVLFSHSSRKERLNMEKAGSPVTSAPVTNDY